MFCAYVWGNKNLDIILGYIFEKREYWSVGCPFADFFEYADEPSALKMNLQL
jgi:hypothetical protein